MPWPRWLRRLWHIPLAEKQLDAELRFHLERQVDAHVADGMSPAEARWQANLEFGGLERFKEECRDARWKHHLDVLIRDFQFAFRGLRKDRRFAFVAIFALALGVAASTAIFSVVDNALLEPFPYKDQRNLVVMAVHNLDDPDPFYPSRSSFPGVLGRSGHLKPGVSPREAQADLNVIAKQLSAVYPKDYPKHFVIQVTRFPYAVVSPQFRNWLFIFCGAVGLLLLISCGNVANLLLARALTREKEFSVRTALLALRRFSPRRPPGQCPARMARKTTRSHTDRGGKEAGPCPAAQQPAIPGGRALAMTQG